MLKEPKNIPLPTEKDFYFDGCVDEKYAIQHYLGKDIDFAEQRYYSYYPLAIFQDFSLVGAKATLYYLFGAYRYLQSEHSIDEPDIYAALPDLLETKLLEDPESFIIVADYLISFCIWAVENYNKFDADVDIYGDVKEKYLALQNNIHALVKTRI